MYVYIYILTKMRRWSDASSWSETTENSCVPLFPVFWKVERLKGVRGVRLVEKDRGAKLMTSYTPEFLGVEKVWSEEGGERSAGDGMVIGFVDSGLNPVHPSFAYDAMNPWSSNGSRFSGGCEEGPLFPQASCNGKIVAARFFAAGAQAVATFNPAIDILSPYDTVGHGRYVCVCVFVCGYVCMLKHGGIMQPRGIDGGGELWSSGGGRWLLLRASQWDGAARKVNLTLRFFWAQELRIDVFRF